MRATGFAAIVCMATLATACASAKLTPGAMERLRVEREIVVARSSETPSFAAYRNLADSAATPGGLMGVVAGDSAAKKAGAQMVKDYTIEHPIKAATTRLVARLASDAGLMNVRQIETPVTGEDVAALKRQIGPLTTFEWRTTSWGVKYHPHDTNVYGAVYQAHARLLALADGRVLWEGQCEAPKYWPDPQPALFDDLTAEGGRLLKARLVAAAERCADDLVAQVLNKPRNDDKREVVRKGVLLSDVRALLLGDTGLVAGPRRFDAAFLDIPVPFGEAVEVVKLFADSQSLPPGSAIKLKGRTVNTPFEANLEKTGAGRLEVTFDGLLFADEAHLRRVVDGFKGPALKELTLDGRVGERLIRIRLGPKGVER